MDFNDNGAIILKQTSSKKATPNKNDVIMLYYVIFTCAASVSFFEFIISNTHLSHPKLQLHSLISIRNVFWGREILSAFMSNIQHFHAQLAPPAGNLASIFQTLACVAFKSDIG